VKLLIVSAILTAIGSPATADPGARVTAAVKASGFPGETLVGVGPKIIYESRTGTSPGKTWRWASVTKQVIATLIMQEVAGGRVDLDKPIATYLPRFASANAASITVRQLLRHQTGLPNPNDTPATATGVEAFYAPGYTGNRDPLTGYCAGPVKGSAGGNWAYNNCDFMVAGALLDAVTGRSWQMLVRDRITKPLGLRSVGAFPSRKRTEGGTIEGKPEPAIDLASFGASAALYGTARDLWTFDRALMTGNLLPQAARDQMWDGQPQLGSIALGQWAFSAPLKGCTNPVRIIERRGGIGGVEIRNFILPEKDTVVIMFVGQSDYAFGEVWQGKGLSFDLLSAAACA